MGGANNRSLISAHFCISAYFLTAETYKRMRLTTRVYGIIMYIVAKWMVRKLPWTRGRFLILVHSRGYIVDNKPGR